MTPRDVFDLITWPLQAAHWWASYAIQVGLFRHGCPVAGCCEDAPAASPPVPRTRTVRAWHPWDAVLVVLSRTPDPVARRIDWAGHEDRSRWLELHAAGWTLGFYR